MRVGCGLRLPAPHRVGSTLQGRAPHGAWHLGLPVSISG
ncbi:hypothetical protein AS9A_2902 [Hoyosella subflava DQS3-9A1]|uniref:Uncharacterized protein n=1 Tax=Hoyosella subflava (strain DSM 45089 / JCM 17490 / NBRC 109087 / DQS3-9A1) TaxID=443218 RepID=F6EJZ1_HOYSD|nr:hypothetical protein AS9A_2902 [Hoyosella subflava DQS3-9A1]